VLVIFAGAIFLLMMMAAVVVDVSWYWVNSLRIQRAADAAALAGAVQLPNDPGKGVSLAKIEATKNGYTEIPLTNTTKVRPKQDTTNPRRMDVTITADVGTFFMRVIGIPTIPATRTAKAEFTLPVPMGSPQNYYGVGILNLPTSHQEQQTTSVSRDTDFRNAGGPITGGQWTPSPTNRSITQVVNDNDGDYATSNNPSQAQAWGNFGMLQTVNGANNPPNSNLPIPIPNAGQTVSIDGIEVHLEDAFLAGGNSCSNTRISVQLSKNNGATWLTAVQAQPFCVETATSCRPPLDATARSRRSRVKTHGAGPWVISTRTPFTTTVPRRSTTWGLAAAAKVTRPSPCPAVPESDSHSASLRASQAHSRLVATTMAPLPPGAARLAGCAEAFTPQRELGAVTEVEDSRPHAPVRAARIATSERCRSQVVIALSRDSPCCRVYTPLSASPTRTQPHQRAKRCVFALGSESQFNG